MCLFFSSRPQVHCTDGGLARSCLVMKLLLLLSSAAPHQRLSSTFTLALPNVTWLSHLGHGHPVDAVLMFPATSLLQLSARVQYYQMTMQTPPNFLPTFLLSCIASRCFPRVVPYPSFPFMFYGFLRQYYRSCVASVILILLCQRQSPTHTHMSLLSGSREFQQLPDGGVHHGSYVIPCIRFRFYPVLSE